MSLLIVSIVLIIHLATELIFFSFFFSPLFRNEAAMGAVEMINGLVDDKHLLGAMNVAALDSRDLIYNLLVSGEDEWLTRYFFIYIYICT